MARRRIKRNVSVPYVIIEDDGEFDSITIDDLSPNQIVVTDTDKMLTSESAFKTHTEQNCRIQFTGSLCYPKTLV